MARQDPSKQAEAEDLKNLCFVILDFFGSLDSAFASTFGESARQSIEAAAEQGHVGALRMARNDLLAMVQDLPAHQRSDLDAALRGALEIPLRDLLAKQRKEVQRIMERGRIRTEVEYYLIREQLELSADIGGDAESAALQALLDSYEERVASAAPTKVRTIYVALLDEGTQVWRPVQASEEGEGRYRIMSGPTPDDEEWEFPPNTVVRCEQRQLSGQSTMSLVAVAQAD